MKDDENRGGRKGERARGRGEKKNSRAFEGPATVGANAIGFGL